jgi:hypothetical protein
MSLGTLFLGTGMASAYFHTVGTGNRRPVEGRR